MSAVFEPESTLRGHVIMTIAEMRVCVCVGWLVRRNGRFDNTLCLFCGMVAGRHSVYQLNASLSVDLLLELLEKQQIYCDIHCDE
jgi:hypothetical protein